MSRFKPSDWVVVGDLAFRTRDRFEATKMFAELDGLTGRQTEGTHKGVRWMTTEQYRARMIESAGG